MTTAFAATKVIDHGNIAPRLKAVTYSLQMPSSWTAAGVACDLSDDFTEVFSISWGGAAAIADVTDVKYGYLGPAGTYGTTAGSSMKLVAHGQRTHSSAETFQILTVVPDSTDQSSATAALITVFGYES